MLIVILQNRIIAWLPKWWVGKELISQQNSPILGGAQQLLLRSIQNVRTMFSIKTVFDRSPRNVLKRFEASKLRRNRNQKYTYKSKTFKKTQNSLKPDSEYGDACQKPDMDNMSFDLSKKQFLKNLQCSSPERRRIERETILQSESGEWLERRRNLLTAYWFGKICNRRMIICALLVK